MQNTIRFAENLNETTRAIHERALMRAKKYLAAEGELLESIMEIDRLKIYEQFGLTHLTPYCVKFLGLSEEVAAAFVRVARKSVPVPELKTALQEGQLTLSKAKAIASVVQENPAVWIERAQTLTRDKLEKEIAKENPSAIKNEKAKFTGANRVRVEFDLTEEEMEKFKRAQDIVSQKLHRLAGLAETQAFLTHFFLEKADPVRKAQRHQRPRGRSAVTHEVNRRDQGQCQALLPDGSKCGNTKWTQHHHIVPRAEGGKDKAQNIVTLCRKHHQMWHREESAFHLA